MKKNVISLIFMITSLSLASFLLTPVHAQTGSSQTGDGTTFFINLNGCNFFPEEFECFFGTPQSPIPVFFDEGAGPLKKQFSSQLFDDDPNTSPPQGSIILHEAFVVAQGPPWTDWHQAAPAGWIWEPSPGVQLRLLDGSIGFNLPGRNDLIQSTDTNVWIFFNPPLPSGTILEVDKILTFVGDPNISGETTTQSAIVLEWPTVNGEKKVGGKLIPLDSTSLLVAGAQMNAAWMIPVIVSGIGIGIVILRKF